MRPSNELILKADFNPKIKTYIKLVVGFIMFITIIGIPILIIWLLGLGNYVGNRYYQNLKCQLTTRHLEFKKGVFFKVEKTIPIENIQDLTFIENPILSMLGLKILKVETAGNSNPQGTDMKLVGIVEAEKFKAKVLDQREILQTQGQPFSDNTEAGKGTSETVELLKEIRDLLKANTKAGS